MFRLLRYHRFVSYFGWVVFHLKMRHHEAGDYLTQSLALARVDMYITSCYVITNTTPLIYEVQLFPERVLEYVWMQAGHWSLDEGCDWFMYLLYRVVYWFTVTIPRIVVLTGTFLQYCCPMKNIYLRLIRRLFSLSDTWQRDISHRVPIESLNILEFENRDQL